MDQVILQAFAPMGFPHMSQTICYKGKEDIKLDVSLQPGNEDYIPFYEMKLMAGRNMFHSDSLTGIGGQSDLCQAALVLQIPHRPSVNRSPGLMEKPIRLLGLLQIFMKILFMNR